MTRTSNIRFALLLSTVALLTALVGHASAQSSDGAAPVGDTISERASWALEQQRRANNPQPQPTAAPLNPAAPVLVQRAGSAPDFAVTGIRGFASSLEASYLINGKRATGSVKFPTLVDGWKVVSIAPTGSVIAKMDKGNKEQRKQLSFSGPSPYQPAPAADQQQQQGMPTPFGTLSRSAFSDLQNGGMASAPPPLAAPMPAAAASAPATGAAR